MNGKPNVEGKEKKLEIDVEAFELQIDKEIDSLFIPAGLSGTDGEQGRDGVTAEGETPHNGAKGPSEDPGLNVVGGEKPVDKPNLELDVQAFEFQIDKEIDSLFVPLGQSQETAEKPAIMALDDAKLRGELHSGTAPPPSLDSIAAEKPSPQLEIEGIVESVAQLAPLQVELEKGVPRDADRSELINLIEAFNIAYLSLDWEFSVENISKLGLALEKLGLHCRNGRETLFLFKILKVVLDRLKAQPTSVHPQLLELVRGAQDILKPLLISGGSPSQEQKDKLKSLVARFQSMKGELLVGKESRTGKLVSERAESIAVEKERPSALMTPRPSEAFDRQPLTLDGLREWMRSFRSASGATILGLEEENGRLLQIEELLSRTPVLAHVASRLSKIRFSLEDHVLSLKERGEELGKRLDWLGSFEVGFESQSVMTPEQIASEQTAPSQPPRIDTRPQAEGSAPEAVETRQEQVILFNLCGRQFAVLASNVVKIEPVAAKKAAKIQSRGFATLADFKPLFKSVKTGLMGVWGGLPAETLKTYRFLPVPSETLDVPDAPSACAGVILLGSGRNHGMLFTDSADIGFQNEAEIIVRNSDKEAVLGIIETESGSPIEVLNMDRILKRLRQGAAGDV